MKVSFILPIYNVEKYLSECAESILAQTYRDFEILLVDDGSPDNCPALCDEWAKKDSRIKALHKPNGGLSDARNYGLEHAQGDYVVFVDSDDYISKTLLKDIEPYINQNIDLIKWKPIFVEENGNIKTNLKKNYVALNLFQHLK